MSDSCFDRQVATAMNGDEPRGDQIFCECVLLFLLKKKFFKNELTKAMCFLNINIEGKKL